MVSAPTRGLNPGEHLDKHHLASPVMGLTKGSISAGSPTQHPAACTHDTSGPEGLQPLPNLNPTVAMDEPWGHT